MEKLLKAAEEFVDRATHGPWRTLFSEIFTKHRTGKPELSPTVNSSWRDFHSSTALITTTSFIASKNQENLMALIVVVDMEILRCVKTVFPNYFHSGDAAGFILYRKASKVRQQ